MRYLETTYGYFPPGLVDLFSCRLVLCGSASHRGESKSAVLDIDLSSGRVSMALLGDGQNTICQDKYPATIAGLPTLREVAYRQAGSRYDLH